MKTKRQGYRRVWEQALSALLTLALAVGLVLAVPAADGVAYGAPLDLTVDGDGGGNCSLTLKFQTGTDAEEELAADETVVDLYQIAAAVDVPGYDVYAYNIKGSSPFYSVVSEYLAREEVKADWNVTENADGLTFYYAPDRDAQDAPAEQMELTQLLAETIRQEKIEPAASTTIGVPARNLAAGLYVALVHDADTDDYFALEQAVDAEDTLCTAVVSEQHVFMFQPNLVSLPGRLVDGEQTNDTTLDGTWNNDVTIYTKAFEHPRYADLEIVKQVNSYLAVFGEDTTVVFRVTAVDPTGKTVFEKIVPITLNGTNQPEPVVLANMIPAGSTVVIKEEYGGATYSLESISADWRANEGSTADVSNGLQYNADLSGKCVTIENIPAGNIHLTVPGETSAGERVLPDGTTETVTFVNTYNSTIPGGGSVVNSFAGEAIADGEAYRWVWIKSILDGDGIWTTVTPVPVQ